MRVRTATWLAWSVCALSWMLTALGGLVASRRPELPVGWLFCAIGFLAGPTKAAHLIRLIHNDRWAVHRGSPTGIMWTQA
jgi:hypothetical protein